MPDHKVSRFYYSEYIHLYSPAYLPQKELPPTEMSYSYAATVILPAAEWGI